MREIRFAGFVGGYLIAVTAFLSMTGCGWMDYDRWGGHGPGMMGWFGPFGMILFWVVVIVLIVVVGRAVLSSGRRDPGTAVKETSLDVLKKRYARGEITKEDFEQMRRDLEE